MTGDWRPGGDWDYHPDRHLWWSEQHACDVYLHCGVWRYSPWMGGEDAVVEFETPRNAIEFAETSTREW